MAIPTRTARDGRVWKLPADPSYALPGFDGATRESHGMAPWKGWVPWLLMIAVVIAWVHLKLNTVGEMKIAWPMLHNEVFITAYNKPYEAIWGFQPLSTGTAILAASALVASMIGRTDPMARTRRLSERVRARFIMATPSVEYSFRIVRGCRSRLARGIEQVLGHPERI